MIKILLGGSPCTYWSAMKREGRETSPSGEGWELFRNYLIAKEKFRPDFFIYENVKSASEAIKRKIASCLGVGIYPQVRMTYINSALVSAQNRERFYITNFGDIEQPADRSILLKDILESGEDLTGRDKSYALTATYYKASVRKTLEKRMRSMVAESSPDGRYVVRNNRIYTDDDNIFNVKPLLTKLADGRYSVRKLTPLECERLQTLPDDYTKCAGKTQRYKMLGNAWTAEVIIHLLNQALSDVPRDEEIVVLSMYDGIGTGRYCLDKMGFTNVTYYSYETDGHAIAVALDNYPDIIQCGGAFEALKEDWEL